MFENRRLAKGHLSVAGHGRPPVLAHGDDRRSVDAHPTTSYARGCVRLYVSRSRAWDTWV